MISQIHYLVSNSLGKQNCSSFLREKKKLGCMKKHLRFSQMEDLSVIVTGLYNAGVKKKYLQNKGTTASF